MSKSTPYRECPYCGDKLDRGELCECRNTSGADPEATEASAPVKKNPHGPVFSPAA